MATTAPLARPSTRFCPPPSDGEVVVCFSELCGERLVAWLRQQASVETQERLLMAEFPGAAATTTTHIPVALLRAVNACRRGSSSSRPGCPASPPPPPLHRHRARLQAARPEGGASTTEGFLPAAVTMPSCSCKDRHALLSWQLCFCVSDRTKAEPQEATRADAHPAFTAGMFHSRKAESMVPTRCTCPAQTLVTEEN